MARLENTAASATTTAAKKKNAKTTTAKRSDAKPSARERSASKPRDEKKTRTAKRDNTEIVVTLKMVKETKNKYQFIELDDEGDQIENPFGGDCKIGQIYLTKDLFESKPKKITVTISE